MQEQNVFFMEVLMLYAIVMIIITIPVIFFFIRRAYLRKHGEVTKKKVSKYLARRGALRSWKVFKNEELTDGKDTALCDHIVVNNYGVFLINDLYYSGSIYGDLENDKWIRGIGKDEETAKKTTIDNPIYINDRVLEIFRNMLAKEKIYNVQIETLVVNTQNAKVFVTKSDKRIIKYKDLNSYFEKVKFEKDNNTEIERISAMISKLNNK